MIFFLSLEEIQWSTERTIFCLNQGSLVWGMGVVPFPCFTFFLPFKCVAVMA